MAAPLFVTDEATLKARLRLSAIPATAADTEAIIDQAILKARLRFYRDLGAARVNALKAVGFSETPETDEQVLRALAFTTEVTLVYCELLRALPNTFMDASGDVNKRWDEEAPTRERGGMELDEEMRRCEQEVAAAMIELADPAAVDCSDVMIFDGTPTLQTTFPVNTPRVGMTLKSPSSSGHILRSED